MTREEPLSSNHGQNLIEDFRQAKMDSTTIFCSRAAWKSKRRGGPRRCYRSRKAMRCSPMVGANASLRQAGVGQLKRVDNAKKKVSIELPNMEKGYIAHCTPVCSIVQLALTLSRYMPLRDRGRPTGNVLRHGSEDHSYIQSARGRRETLCCNIVWTS